MYFVSMSMFMKRTRSYVMTARADAVAQTRESVLQAAITLSDLGAMGAISLGDIAAEAGVSVQTVLRQFGSRAALLDEVVELLERQVADERAAPTDDVPAAMSVLIDHYEARGDSVLTLLSQEATDERVSRLTNRGRAMHRAWVEDVFNLQLGDVTGSEREEMIDMLVIATDVYTWKILRRDRGLSRKVVERRMLRLVEAVLGGESDD